MYANSGQVSTIVELSYQFFSEDPYHLLVREHEFMKYTPLPLQADVSYIHEKIMSLHNRQRLKPAAFSS